MSIRHVRSSSSTNWLVGWAAVVLVPLGHIDGEPGGQAWPVTHSASCTTGSDSAALAVDGDTSTSDTVFVATTNKKGLELTKDKKKKATDMFYKELEATMIDLAKKIVMDGEGATKFIEVRVKNAKDIYRARKICFSIANSVLVRQQLPVKTRIGVDL